MPFNNAFYLYDQFYPHISVPFTEVIWGGGRLGKQQCPDTSLWWMDIMDKAVLKQS